LGDVGFGFVLEHLAAWPLRAFGPSVESMACCKLSLAVTISRVYLKPETEVEGLV